MRNVRLAFRTLFRTPFVTAVAVLSLALGIGANAAIFSLMDQVLLKPLPVPEPERLVNLTAPGPNPGSQSCNQAGNCDEVFSYPMYKDLEARQQVFTGLAAHRGFQVNLAIDNAPMSGQGMMVSGRYFQTLELVPELGRLIQPADDSIIGTGYVAVLSHSFWKSRFAADRNVVGKNIIVNGKSFQIIGVAPKDFEGTTLGTRPLVFVPLTMRGELQGFKRWDNRRVYWIYLFGRLKQGVSV